MRARRCSMTGLVAGSLLLVVLLAGCTDAGEPSEEDPEPAPDTEPSSPPIGVDVAVVPPARSTTAPAILAALDVDLQVLATANEPEVREIRVLPPDEPVFVRDLAEFAGRDAVDLTCVVEADGARIVTDLRDLRPAVRYCAVVGAAPEESPPDGIDLVVLRADELGHVVGIAAAALPGDHVGVASGGSDLPVDGFVDGLLAGLGETTVTRLELDDAAETDDEDPPDPGTRVARAVTAGVDTIVVGWGADAPALVAAAQEAGLQVVGPQELAADDEGEGFALTWRIRWDRVLQPAVDRVAERSDPAERSVGFGQGVFEVQLPGDVPELADLVDQAIAELTTGVRDPLTPPEPPPDPDPEEDDEGDDGDQDGDGDGDAEGEDGPADDPDTGDPDGDGAGDEDGPGDADTPATPEGPPASPPEGRAPSDGAPGS